MGSRTGKDIIDIFFMYYRVYEEEVLESHDAMWFSPTGAYLAFIKFNDSLVPEYPFPKYNPPNSYPENIAVKYPKVFISRSYLTLNTSLDSRIRLQVSM